MSATESNIKFRELAEPSRLLFGLFFATFLGNAVLKRRRLGPFDATEKWAFAFSLILIASALFQSKRPVYNLRVACDAFIIPFIAYFCARRLVTTEDQLRQLVRVIGYLGVYLIAIGLVERLTLSGFSRVHGPFDGRDELFITMAVIFFVVLVDAIRSHSADEKKALPHLVQKFVLCFAPVIVLFGWGRGNLVGLFSGIWIFVFLARRLLTSRFIMTLAGVALLVGPIIGAGLYMLTPQEVVDSRISRPNTIYSRFGAWQNIMNEVTQSPVFGLGLNNLRDALEENRISIEGVKSETHPHNSPLAVLAELGFLGFLVLAGVFASILRTSLGLYRTGSNIRARWQGIAVASVVTAYLVGSLFTNSLYLSTVSHVYVYVLVGAVAGLYARHRSTFAVSAASPDRRWITVDSAAGV